MDIQLLRTFLELDRTRHFGKAAEILSVTQSAVSARIRLLEETLGVPLFIRRRNEIQAGVRRFRENSQAAGGDSDDDLQRRDGHGCEHRIRGH